MARSYCSLQTMALAFALLLLSPAVVAQKCDRRSALVSDTDVFESPPRYVTGVGWRGNVLVRLPSGTEVYICRESNVDFGFASKTWVQIAYRQGPQWPKYGWVIKEAMRAARNADPDADYWTFLVGSAQAASRPSTVPSTAPSAEPADTGQLPAAAPPAPAPSEATGNSGNTMLPSTEDLLALYLPLFYAMLLGMCAKVLVDMLDAWDKRLLWAHLRNGVIAILVSPIVFLGLLSAGQFSGEKQTFVVLALLAFQNGFFWQTILKRDSDRTRKPGALVNGRDVARGRP